MEMNKEIVTFFGRLGKNPELRYTKTQKPVCHLSVAIDSAPDNKTIWNKVIVWGEQATDCNLYLKKGKPVFVRGQKIKKSFTNQKGEEIHYIEINAFHVGIIHKV